VVVNYVSVDKFEKHAVIKYLFLKGMSGKAIHDDMLATLGDNAPVYSVVKSRLAEFKRGRNNVEDEHCSGRPKNAASTENVQIVNDMLKLDGCIVWNAHNTVLGEEAILIYIVPVCYVKTGKYGKPSNIIISLHRKKFSIITNIPLIIT